jgi:hypothetical protein
MSTKLNTQYLVPAASCFRIYAQHLKSSRSSEEGDLLGTPEIRS